MVIIVIKNFNKRTKCASINPSDDYRMLIENMTNPYCYNFGKVVKRHNSSTFQKLHNKTNSEFLK